MFGVLTNKGKVPFISLDEFISIDKMKYFNEYLHKQLYDGFLNQPSPPEYLKSFIENKDIHSVFSTYYDDITLDQSWDLIHTYLPELIDYLKESVMEDIGGFFILDEVGGSAPNFHRDWGEDTTGDKHEREGLYPTEKEARKTSENWIWFKFSETKKLYVSDIDGKDDISKRIPVKSYGVYFNGLDYHGSYDDSHGFSIRLHGILKDNVRERLDLI
tara:strand:- start:51 stop:698 length:648 start_codon:yes stop_codon:yes gene_type:complete